MKIYFPDYIYSYYHGIVNHDNTDTHTHTVFAKTVKCK